MNRAWMMLCRSLTPLLVLLCGVTVLHAGPSNTAVRITPRDGGSLIVTPVYTAQIGADGNLRALQARGIPLLADDVPGLTGAAFFTDRAVPLAHITQRENTITATDGIFTATYQFTEELIAITLRHDARANAAYVVAASPRIAYVENLETQHAAVTPAEVPWGEVRWGVSSGEALELRGGSRGWGLNIGRQVWECTGLAPGRDHTIILTPTAGAPRMPSLMQMVALTIKVPEDQLSVPVGSMVETRTRLENNAGRPVVVRLTLTVKSTLDATLRTQQVTLTCPPRQAVTHRWMVAPTVPDGYTVYAEAALGEVVLRDRAAFVYDAAHINADVARPDDFDAFWAGIIDAARANPATCTRTLDATASSERVAVYRVEMPVDGVVCHGWLSCPRQPGTYPGVLLVASGETRRLYPNARLAQSGLVVFTIELTGQDIAKPLRPLTDVLDDRLTDPHAYPLGMLVRRNLQALAVLAAQREVDPERLGVSGVGLGGGIALMLAGLDPRIRAAAPDLPLGCDLAYGHERASWPLPGIAAYLKAHPDDTPAVWRTLSYFDVLNFAPRVTCPVLISVGVADDYAWPRNIYAAGNRLAGPHEIKLYAAGHEGNREHWGVKVSWLLRALAPPPDVRP